MKSIFFVMLLANLGYFVWQTRYAEPEEAPITTTQAPIPGHVNRLLMLSEFDAGELRARASSIAEKGTGPASSEGRAAAGEAERVVDGICFSIGPLSSQEDVERIGVWLSSRGGDPRLREGERREISVFWVYFPPFPSREIATKRVSSMREAQIEDIYVIPRGDMTNAVSLGLYSRRTSLDRRLAELRGKGYEPSIVPRYKTSKASWFDVKFPDGFEFPEERFAEIFPDTDATAANCTAQLL